MVTTQEISQSFLQYMSHKKLSASTVQAYVCDVNSFLCFVSEYYNSPATGHTLGSLSTQDLRAWLTHRVMKSGISKRSNNRALSALRIFCKYMKEERGITNDFAFLVKSTKTPRLTPKPADLRTIENLIAAQESSQWIELRDKALLMLLYGCGLRISEALAIKDRQIDLDTLFIKVVGKGNRERTVPVLTNVVEAIMEYMAVRPSSKDGFLFIGLRGKGLSRSYFTRKLSKMSNGKLTSHKLRHSCASHLLNNGCPIKLVQQLLGHRSLTSTQIYTEASKQNIIDKYNLHHQYTKEEGKP